MLTWASSPISVTHVVTTPQVRAELMAHAPDGLGPGKTVWLGLQLTHQPQWHTYWKNSGDSGLPTTLAWTLPQGLSAGEIAWPLPYKLRIATLANYGYEGTVLLPVPLTIAPGFQASGPGAAVEIRLKASWLVCRQECIPEEGEFALRLPVNGSTALHGGAFTDALARQPKAVMGSTGGVLPGSTARIGNKELQLEVQGLPVAVRGQPLELFVETPEVIETAATPTQAWQGSVWTARVPLSAHRSNSPGLMPLVLVSGKGAERAGYRVEAQVLGEWPTTAPQVANTPGLSEALPVSPALAAPTNTLSLWAALLGALLGGLLLNLMPCVFPVLALKVMGFTAHAGDRRAHRISGLAYTAGVVLSLLVLAGLMLGLRSAGEQLGWGFQLQSPAVVAGLAGLFTLLALNLTGLFEFGNVLPQGLLTARARHPGVDAALSGVLAVAVASPCTAPFMGASLGLALGLPTAQAMLVFGVMGIGMALPYLAASFVPAVAHALPRPGAWMQTFRQAMAFPMLATVVWLLWVLGQQSGIDGAAALLSLLLTLTLVVWALGKTGPTRRWLATLSIAAFIAMVWAVGPFVTRVLPSGEATAANARWQPWSPQAVEQSLARGQPVFVDFTAAWCVTCQYNKQTTLANQKVLAAFEQGRVTLLRADWTRRDPAITTALAQLGRNGVPVYAWYSPGQAPVLLPEVLSTADVLTVVSQKN